MLAESTAASAAGTAIAHTTNAHKGPKKPEPTKAPLDVLLACYNSQVPAYNEAVEKLAAGLTKVPDTLAPMETMAIEQVTKEQVTKEQVIELLKRQNRRLGRTVRRRALELLEQRIKDPVTGLPQTDADGRSIGLKYKEVLGIIHEEFPEASTSVACLRWYVVHLRMDANDLGLPWPDLPQIRPRAKGPAKDSAE